MIRDVFDGLLFVGDALAARDRKQIYDHSLEAVLDLAANEPPAVLGRDIIYCRYPLTDDESNDDRILVLAIECLESLLRNKYRTLVACGAGMSRSVVIAASALSIRTDVPLDLALKNVTMDAPRDVSPGLFKSVIRVHKQIANKI